MIRKVVGKGKCECMICIYLYFYLLNILIMRINEWFFLSKILDGYVIFELELEIDLF